MKRLKAAGRWLLGIVGPLIITALITGQPLTGLVKLRGLAGIFIHSHVPAWTFAVVLIVAVMGTIHFLEHLKKAKTKLHFIPDPETCTWNKAGDHERDGKPLPTMFLHIHGTFTYDGDKEIQFLSAYLKSTRPVSPMRTNILISATQRMEVPTLWLVPHEPKEAFIDVLVTPVLGTPGKSYQGSLMFLDQYSREHDVGVLDLRPRR